MNDVIERILVTEEEIIKRSKELGAVITQDYRDAGKTPIVVGLLKGSVPFLAEIMKHIDLDKSVKGESILLVEDIVDTGRTLKEVKKLLLHKGAADVKIVSLLDKPSRRVIEVQADYVGFEIPNEFVVGYGLDYDQKYRNLPYIGVLRPQVYENR